MVKLEFDEKGCLLPQKITYVVEHEEIIEELIKQVKKEKNILEEGIKNEQ